MHDGYVIRTSLPKRKILIFGGTGFVGRHICEHLFRLNADVTVVSRSPDVGFLTREVPGFKWMSVEDFTLATADSELARVDLVIHLAYGSIPSTSWHCPSIELDNNVKPALEVFTRLLDLNPRCHIIYASSGGQIYGENTMRMPSKETDPVAPRTPYALGKQLTEQLLAYLGTLRKARVTVLRIANPVGHWQRSRKHGFVSAVVNALLTRTKVTLFGDGHNVRDYFDVDDLAILIGHLAHQANIPTGTFNIGSGIPKTELDVIATAEQVLSSKLEYEKQPARAFDLKYAVLDTSVAEHQLGWVSNATLPTLIEKVALGGRIS